jgi:hypothetical protein
MTASETIQFWQAIAAWLTVIIAGMAAWFAYKELYSKEGRMFFRKLLLINKVPVQMKNGSSM